MRKHCTCALPCTQRLAPCAPRPNVPKPRSPEALHARQFLCLLLAVPFLFVSTAALQLPTIVGDEASRLIKTVSGWLATLGAATAALVMLVRPGRRRLARQAGG